MSNQTVDSKYLWLTLISTMLWGFNFVTAKYALVHFSPFFMLELRFLLVVVLLLPFYPKPPLAIKDIALVSFTFAVLHLGCMFWSLHLGLSASVSVTVEQVAIPILLVLSVFFFKEKIGIKSITGVLLAVVGTYVLMGTPDSIEHPFAFALMLLSALFWAMYSIVLKRLPSAPVLGMVAWTSLLSMPMLLPLMWIYEGQYVEQIKTATLSVWISLIYTSVAASIIAHGLWFYVIGKNPIHTVAPITLLVPLFGALGGVWWLDEPLSREMIIGFILMMMGVSIVVVRRPKMMKYQPEDAV